MSRAIVPQEMPALPRGMVGWARSTRRAGGVFHAHALGWSKCGTIALDRHRSQPAASLGDMQYWGVCPRCYRAAIADPEPAA